MKEHREACRTNVVAAFPPNDAVWTRICRARRRDRLLLVAKLCGGQFSFDLSLTEGSKLTRQAITKHLRVLETAGIVRSVRTGRENDSNSIRRRLKESRIPRFRFPSSGISAVQVKVVRRKLSPWSEAHIGQIADSRRRFRAPLVSSRTRPYPVPNGRLSAATTTSNGLEDVTVTVRSRPSCRHVFLLSLEANHAATTPVT